MDTKTIIAVVVGAAELVLTGETGGDSIGRILKGCVDDLRMTLPKEVKQ